MESLLPLLHKRVRNKKEGKKQELEAIESEHLKKLERKEGRGDLAGTWKIPMTQLLDSIFIISAHRTSRVSPVLSSIFYDGNYLRAMIGSLAALLHPLGLLLGVPRLILQLASFFADRNAPSQWKYEGPGRFLYRFGGIVIFFFIIEIALGKNLVDLLLGN